MDSPPARLSHTTIWLGIFAAWLAVLGLVGNALDSDFLCALVPGRPRMRVSSALLLITLSLRIAVRGVPQPGRARRVSSQLMAGAVSLFGLLAIAEYAFDAELGIDWQLSVATGQGPHPGRPSLLSAAIFAALGSAMLLADVAGARATALREGLCIIGLFFTFVSLIGHTFGAGSLYVFSGSRVVGLALPTGLALSALGIAELLSHPQQGLVRIIRSQGPGGVLLRRLGLTAVLAAPLLDALLLSLVEAVGIGDLPLTLAVGNVLAVSLSLLLLVATAVPVERSHQAAEASRARVREVVEEAPEGIFIADLQGRYTEVNAAGCRLLDLSREEILAKTIIDFIPAEHEARLWKARANVLKGTVNISEWKMRRGDGTYVPVEVTSKVLPDGRWQAFVRDITERLELEQKLLESRDFLQRVLEASTEYGIIADDLERRVVLWNEGARRTYGYALQEILSEPTDLLVAPAELAAYEALRTRALEQGSAEGPLSARRKDGTTFFANFVCTRRLGPDNRIAGVLIVSRDLTEEQRDLAEQEFLARVGVELASCLEYRETLTRVVQLVTSFLGDLAAIDMLKDGVIRRICALHRDPRKLGVAEAVEHAGPRRAKGHPLWTVLETKQPVLLTDISDADRRSFGTSREHAQVLDEVHATSAMLVPLIARGQLLAVLSISACDGSRRYGPADLRLAMEVARRAALAVDNVQLYQQSRLEAAMTTNLADGVVLTRASDATIVYTNRRFEAMFGYEPGGLIGKPAAALNARGEQSPEQQAELIIAQLRRSGAWHGEVKNLRRDGSEFWCAASVSTFEHEEYGTVWIAAHSDITERRRLEEKNAQALRDKEALLKEVHHRVKNNLQVISSLFSLQRERTESSDLKQLLEESQTRVESIALVHEQLYRSADLAAIDLDEYLHALALAIRSTYGATQVEMEIDASDVTLNAEEAVPCALLVCELVSNSLKHAFGGAGKVWIRACRDARGQCTLEVADNGRGIPPEFDWTKARSLGLRLVQGFARQLRGAVELDRSSGTRFIVKFALHRHQRL